jgi:hypothetical protein
MTTTWDPSGTWHRVHGDGKSTTGGNYHMEVMHDSDGRYHVKIVGGAQEQVTFDSEPTFTDIVDELKSKFG